jgi:hypothetical protein
VLGVEGCVEAGVPWSEVSLLDRTSIYFTLLLMNSEQINQRMDLKRLLECIDGPIERMSADLESIKDGFECKLLT